MTVRAGVASRDITPAAGLPMGGYAARPGVAAGVRDPLRCRALVLEDGGQTAAVVVLDLVYVTRPWADEVRRTIAARLGCPPAHVLLAATHTHAGPGVFGSAPGGDPRLRACETALLEAAWRTADAARRNLVAVTGAVGAAAAAGVAADRRHPEREIDTAVRVLVLRARDDVPVAALAAFGCHPTVLPPEDLRYSADLFGAAAEAASRALGAPVVLCNAAAADVSTRFTRRGRNDAELDRLGALLGRAIVAAASAAHPVRLGAPHGDERRVPVEAAPAPPLDEAQAAAAAAAARFAACDATMPRALWRAAEAAAEGAAARLLFALAGGASRVLGREPDHALVQRLRCGGMDLLGVPGEVFSATGRALVGGAARPTLLVGYANDYLGYLVPAGAAAAGGYEADVALLTPASAAAVVAAARELTAP